MKALFLKSSSEIRNKVRHVMSAKGRRVAIVAFVGLDAEDYLGKHPKGIEIYCWPKAGGTHPEAIQQLQEKGVAINFVDRLHMKVYWSASAGCVIGSANLTNNALGEGGLREAAVYIQKSSSINIRSLLATLNHRPVGNIELSRLFREHEKYTARNGRPRGSQKNKTRTFREWVAGGGLPEWLPSSWGEWYSKSDEARLTKDVAAQGLDPETEYESISFKAKRREHWLLCYKINKGKTRLAATLELDWMFAEKVRKLSLEKGYPYTVFQFKELRNYGNPPFRLDASFRKRFSRVAEVLGPKIMTSENPADWRRIISSLKNAV